MSVGHASGAHGLPQLRADAIQHGQPLTGRRRKHVSLCGAPGCNQPALTNGIGYCMIHTSQPLPVKVVQRTRPKLPVTGTLPGLHAGPSSPSAHRGPVSPTFSATGPPSQSVAFRPSSQGLFASPQRTGTQAPMSPQHQARVTIVPDPLVAARQKMSGNTFSLDALRETVKARAIANVPVPGSPTHRGLTSPSQSAQSSSSAASSSSSPSSSSSTQTLTGTVPLGATESTPAKQASKTPTIKGSVIEAFDLKGSSSGNAVLRQRMRRSALIREKLAAPVIGNLDQKRGSMLLTLLTKRPTAVALNKRGILITEADKKERVRRSSVIGDFLKARPTVTSLAQKNIIVEEGKALQHQKRANALTNFLGRRPSVVEMQQRGLLVRPPSGGTLAEGDQEEEKEGEDAPGELKPLPIEGGPNAQARTSFTGRRGSVATVPAQRRMSVVTGTMGAPRVVRPPSATGEEEEKKEENTEELEQTEEEQQLLEVEAPPQEDIGGVYLWGSNSHGQVGTGDVIDAKTPFLLSVLAKDVVVQVCCGATHTMVRTDTGSLYTWGGNAYGQLGLGDQADRHVPYRTSIRDSALFKKTVIYVAAGPRTSMCVTDEDEVFSWGSAKDGALGIGVPKKDCELLPVEIRELKGEEIHRMALADDHSLAVSENGNLFTWGNNDDGQLGHPETKAQYTPKLLARFAERVAEVACGERFSAAVMLDGHLYTWGNNQHGQLGHGNNTAVATPKQVAQLAREGIAKVACGRRYTTALTDDGRIFTTLEGKFARILPEGEFRDVDTTTDYIIALGATGMLYAWSLEKQSVTTEFDEFQSRYPQQLAAGETHCACIASLPPGLRNKEQSSPLNEDGEPANLKILKPKELNHVKVGDMLRVRLPVHVRAGPWKFLDRNNFHVVSDVQQQTFVNGGATAEFRFLAVSEGVVTITAINRGGRHAFTVEVTP